MPAFVCWKFAYNCVIGLISVDQSPKQWIIILPRMLEVLVAYKLHGCLCQIHVDVQLIRGTRTREADDISQ